MWFVLELAFPTRLSVAYEDVPFPIRLPSKSHLIFHKSLASGFCLLFACSFGSSCSSEDRMSRTQSLFSAVLSTPSPISLWTGCLSWSEHPRSAVACETAGNPSLIPQSGTRSCSWLPALQTSSWSLGQTFQHIVLAVEKPTLTYWLLPWAACFY